MASSDSDSDEFMFDSEYESDGLKPKTAEQKYLCAAIRDGDLDRARSFFENSTPEIRQKITEDSSLMIAALEEDDPEFIRFLVEECNADLEKSMKHPLKYRYLENCDDSITPLNYSAKFQKTEAAVELMRLGANVNAVSPSSGMTALHHACENGMLDTVRHLIQHGADLTKSDIHGKTALMYGVDHLTVCREIIRRGADVNATDNDGNTALHLAARESTAVVKLLMNNGADLLRKNGDGLDALCIASVYRNRDAVKFMRDQLSNDDVGHQALRRSHQLEGACQVNYYQMQSAINPFDKALSEWKTAVRLREERRHIITGEDDVVSAPNSAYDNALEVDSMVKFDEMRQDRNKIYIQSLLLKEKILGPTHHETVESVMHLVDYYLGNDDYGRGLRLLRHCIRLSLDRRVNYTMESFEMDDLNLGSVCSVIQSASCNKHTVKNSVSFQDIYEFLEVVTHETRRQRQPTTENNCFVKSYIECAENESFMLIVLFLIKLCFLLETSEVNAALFRRLVHDFVRLNLRSLDGRTILMKAICPVNPDDYECIEWFSLDIDVIKLLLECGADPGETDNKGNSVLHLLENSEDWLSDATEYVPSEETTRTVAEVLLEFGAHFDARNNEGFTALGYLSSLGLEFSTHMTLQCLAAQAIRRHEIPCTGILPKSLLDFVEMH